MRQIKYPLTQDELNELLEYRQDETVWTGVTASLLWLSQTFASLMEPQTKMNLKMELSILLANVEATSSPLLQLDDGRESFNKHLEATNKLREYIRRL